MKMRCSLWHLYFPIPRQTHPAISDSSWILYPFQLKKNLINTLFGLTCSGSQSQHSICEQEATTVFFSRKHFLISFSVFLKIHSLPFWRELKSLLVIRIAQNLNEEIIILIPPSETRMVLVHKHNFSFKASE